MIAVNSRYKHCPHCNNKNKTLSSDRVLFCEIVFRAYRQTRLVCWHCTCHLRCRR
ncbi:hypothetical protein [Moraxella lacunata]|uniref:hypothetical protein n=1 Tax=Moraxella lacunata TaxID=477 RepID=UPI003EDE95E2